MNIRTKIASCLGALALAATVFTGSPASAADANGDKIDDFYQTPGWANTPRPGSVPDDGTSWMYPNYPLICNSPTTTDRAFKFIVARHPTDADWFADPVKAARIQKVIRTAVSVSAATRGTTHATEAVMRGQSGAARVETVAGTGLSCSANIASITLPLAAFQSLEAMEAELRARGFNRPDRKYFVLSNENVRPPQDSRGTFGGLAQSKDWNGLGEQLVHPANGLSYGWAAVSPGADDNLWRDADVLAHEMAHGLGAVHMNAPHWNPSNEGHPSDCLDVLCYTNGEPGQTVVSSCNQAYPGGTGFSQYRKSWYRMDCNQDDYYKPYSTLYGKDGAVLWNVAKSSFLHGNPQPTSPTLTGAKVQTTIIAE